MDERFLRQEMLLGRDAVKRLACCHVAVFGLGGVGGAAAEALARAGVGKLTLVDGDVFSETNINRQIGALSSTVGRLKAEVMAERVRDISPSIEVTSLPYMYTSDDRERFFGEYDYIIDAIDTVSCKLDLIETAIQRGIPIVSSLGTGNKLDPTCFRFADIYQTHTCPLARVLRNELKKRGVETLRVLFSNEVPLEPFPLDEPQNGRRTVPGSVSWVPPVAGMMLAGDVVRRLAGV